MSKNKKILEDVEVFEASLVDEQAPENVVEDVVDETVKEPIEETPAAPVTGVVTNCLKLNIRENPNTDSKVVCEVTMLDELVIDEEASTDEWFKVYTEMGVEGFCMKKYVAVKQ